MITDLVLRNRSYRRFKEDEHISFSTLKELVDMARLTPSAANLQPLKYILSNTGERNQKIFSSLAWAGYLKEWKGPEPGERPSAYIAILSDKSISNDCKYDCGIAAQTMLLAAVEKGLGGCLFGAVNRNQLSEQLGLEEHLEILLVIALGQPVEKIQIEPVDEKHSIRYWRDDNQVHHVPKRALEEIIVTLTCE